MPFGPKRTVGISGHYSEAWAIAPQLGAEACRSRWKPVEVVGKQWKTGKGSEGVREVQEVREIRKRSGRPWESAEEAERHGK